MANGTRHHEHYLADNAAFLAARGARDPSWLSALRRTGRECFATSGFPTTRDEEWKYTNVAPLMRNRFAYARSATNGVASGELAAAGLNLETGARLVFVDGHHRASLSSIPAAAGALSIASLAVALADRPEVLEAELAQYVSPRSGGFVALNTAFIEDGACIRIPAGAELTRPIHLIFLTGSGPQPRACYPRNLVLAGARSRATIVESHLSLEGGLTLSNAVTEIVLDCGAELDYYTVQQNGPRAAHISTLQVQQERASRLSAHCFTTAGTVVRNDVNVALAGEASTCTLNGLFLASGRQHVDTHTRIDHLQAGSTSRELYKGVLGGQARGVFSGRVVVHANAQNTDATQTNKNLLLSETASVDSRPQLEIRNDNVRCSHGSTTGQLDPQAIFYLRARGHDLASARRLLTTAFASEIIRQVPLRGLQARLEAWLVSQLQVLHETRTSS